MGFAQVDLGENELGRPAQVRDCYVEPFWRRQGYGASFARALIDWLMEGGIVQLDLKVRQDNPGARAFWQSTGLELALYQYRRIVCSVGSGESCPDALYGPPTVHGGTGSGH
ncbi:MAG: GNAT family N-acetyltransferase [Chloroflexota bacterium]